MTMCYPTTTDWSCYGTQEDIDALNAENKARSEALAWYSLARLCLWQIGVCPTTVRPCAAGCLPEGVSWLEAPVGGGHTAGLPLRTIGTSFTPHLTGGNWVNSCGCSRGGCSCTSLSEVILPGPVGAIEEVRIDGVLLPRTSYRVDNGNRLVRLDGETWPACQDMAAPLGETGYSSFSGTYGTAGEYEFTREGDIVTVSLTPDPAVGLVGTPYPDRFLPASYQAIGGPTDVRIYVQNDAGVGTFLIDRTPGEEPSLVTFSYLGAPAEPDVQAPGNTFAVTYYQGAAPNEMTRFAAGVLAAEFYRACQVGSKGKCRLPSGVKTVVRRGATYEMGTDLFADGVTGIPEVDAVIGIYNPNRLKALPTVSSPDSRRRQPRRSTWLVG